jgi:hypothetical protein
MPTGEDGYLFFTWAAVPKLQKLILVERERLHFPAKTESCGPATLREIRHKPFVLVRYSLLRPSRSLLCRENVADCG